MGDYSRQAIILNIVVKGRRGGEQLFEGGDLSRDGYYSRKYGINVRILIDQLVNKGQKYPS